MNSSSQGYILVALVTVVIAGIIGIAFGHENATMVVGFCTMICVQLLKLLNDIRSAATIAGKVEIVASKVETVATKVEKVSTSAAAEAEVVKDTLKEVTDKAMEKLENLDTIATTALKQQVLMLEAENAKLRENRVQ